MTPEQRATLHGWIRAGTTAQRVVLRSRIVVLAADGLPSKHIAHQLATSQDTVRLWRRRFAVGGPGALTRDAPGRGRKRQVTAAREQQVVEATLHTAPPRATHWSLRTMAAAQGLSPASIHRIWHAHGLQPHRVRTFKLSTDPRFLEKLTDVVGLYVDPPEQALVFCVDEKSQIQALPRSQPGLPMKPGRAGTMTHDYKRHGTTTLFAALNVLEGTVIGSGLARHRHQEFRKFLNLLDAQTPPDVAIHAILDNYATHKHPAIQRWLRRHPRFHLHFVPTSASWLNLRRGLVFAADRGPAATRRLSERPRPHRRDLRVYSQPQSRRRAVHLDRAGRTHPGESHEVPSYFGITALGLSFDNIPRMEVVRGQTI